MQNLIEKFRQSSIVFEKPGILLGNLKNLTNSNLPKVQYVLLKLCTRVLLTNVYKSVFGIFLFCLDLELFAKLKNLISIHPFFIFLLISQDVNKKTKNLEHPFVDICK